MSLALPARLSAKELVHDWRASACFIAALMGVMAPLLLILALKNGIVGTMVGRLIEDPSNRELLAIGAGSHDAGFFEAMAAREDVAFIVPSTRSINGLADAIRNAGERRLERAVQMIPSAAGDPLLDGPPIAPGEVQVTQGLLDGLGLDAGDQLELLIGREIDGRQETARADLLIAGAVPEDRFARPAIFLSLSDLLAVEAFRDDASITPENWRDPRPEPPDYASFRLYAAELDDLRSLENDLEAMGVRARPRAENATLLLAFRRNLNILYSVVAALAVAGFWAAMAANLRSMVERQRVTFSMLRLVGMSDGERRLVPFFQALILVTSGAVLTIILVLPFVLAINRFFGTPAGEFVAYLGPAHVLGTVCVGLLTAVTAPFWAVRAIDGIHPDEVLRHA